MVQALLTRIWVSNLN